MQIQCMIFLRNLHHCAMLVTKYNIAIKRKLMTGKPIVI